jgi:hypothetical protein
MRTRLLLLLLLSCSAAAGAQSDNACPWLTAGTAARVLGGEVSLIAHASGNWDGACVFTRKTSPTAQFIEILVGKTNTHACPESSRQLRALGNEALQCHRIGAHGQFVDTIAGRVRTAFFVVSITAAVSQGPPAADRALPDSTSPLERIAEQVSAALY